MIIPPASLKRLPVPPMAALLPTVNERPVHVYVAPPEADESRYRCIVCSVRTPWDAAREAAERVWAARLSEDELTTEHALLIVWGLFAQHLGLIKGLEEVPLPQKQGVYTPQTKLIEFLLAVLAGVESLHELNEGSQPIVEDVAVAVAWLREGLAHYSGVSRTLQAADEQTVAATLRVLDRVSQPFIQQEVMALWRRKGLLEVDVDLTGRPVSNSSQTYPGSEFGWMDDEVRLGYQAALLSLAGEAASRLWLVGQHLPGQAKPGECLRDLVQAAEAKLGVRPRRRVELLATQETRLAEQAGAAQAQAEQARRQATEAQAQADRRRAELAAAQAQLAELEQRYQAAGRPERSHSQLAQVRHRAQGLPKKIRRAERTAQQATARALQAEARQAQGLAEQQVWATRRLALQADNQANPNPVTILVRMDAGFGSGAQIAWLIEMGYLVYTKAYGDKSTQALRRRLPATATWTRVGKNAEAVLLSERFLAHCPYPLELALVRFLTPKGELFAVLVRYRDDGHAEDLTSWFAHYNARQIIEAGISEGKGVLTLRKPLVRSPAGLALQLHFALFAANFIRWAARWMDTLLRQANRFFENALGQVSTQVKVGTRTAARWVRTAGQRALIWPDHGPFAGTVLAFAGQLACQLALPLFNFLGSSPKSHLSAAVAQPLG